MAFRQCSFFDTLELSKIVLRKFLQFWQSPFWLPTYYIGAVKESPSTITQPIPDLTQTGHNVYRIKRFLENFSMI